MEKISVNDFKENLSNVLKKIHQGSVVEITSGGKVVAKLIPPKYDKEIAIKRLKEISKKAVLKDIIFPVDSKWKELNKD